ncbi:MAG: 30S ribosomal protein S24e [Nitrososphaeria archaeon]|nr:30S ribosomal protein S24e [Nitrososphaeria archaeon]NIN52226.1 30S ribosomal protein S24e [Nitrososphaeria archaeon]NIQ32679.1 30S ribosomal protein S24e [Nitrososphaeria archaeon]
MEITRDEENILLGRREVEFSIEHPGKATPKRAEVEVALAARLKAPRNMILISDLRTLTGKNMTVGRAYIFQDEVKLETVEPRLRRKIPADEEGG